MAAPRTSMPDPTERVHRIWTLVGYVMAVLVGRVRTPPKPDVIDGRAMLYVANHRSMFDIFVGVVLFRRWGTRVSFLVHERYLRHPLLKYPLRGIGAIPVDPEEPLRAVRHAIRLLESGRSVLIMPEGRIAPVGTPRDELLELTPGAALLANRGRCPIGVGGICGADDVWPADATWPTGRPWRRPQVTVTAEFLPAVVGERRDDTGARIADALARQVRVSAGASAGAGLRRAS